MPMKSSDRPTTEEEISDLSFIEALPSALSAPAEGHEVLSKLRGATIIQVGTTTPGLIEGGGLLMDYRDVDGNAHRIVFGFTERGMWVERLQSFPS